MGRKRREAEYPINHTTVIKPPTKGEEFSSRTTHPLNSGYIPPHLREAYKRNDEIKLRVNNLPDGTTKKDLRDLFCRFGTIKCTRYISRHARAGEVCFSSREKAYLALEKLNGYCYGNLILQ